MLESQGVIAAVNGGLIADAASLLNSSLRLFTLDDRSDPPSLRACADSRGRGGTRGGAARTQHLEEMDAAVRGTPLADSGGDRFIDADLRFHLAVAEATGNRLVLHSMQAVRDVVRRALTTVFVIPHSLESAVVEHRAIRAAIASGDPARTGRR
jgi:DNA-binding GntR family transcriptional regulator